MLKSNKKTICLNMIVKNESAIIERCLNSLVNQIDYWVIVDTGSTDNTPMIIKNFMMKNNVPGELIERPWVNFSHNRTEALELAENKADYVLLCDADMVLEVIDSNWKDKLTGNSSYLVIQKNNTLRYQNVRLINGRLKGNERFRYFGATHEYCESINGLDMPMFFAGIEFFDYQDGGSKSDKFTRDIKLLTDEINRLNSIDDSLDMDKQQLIEEGILQRKNKLIQRCTFYLAQSWRDLDEYEKALETYEERVKLGGWEEEVYYSLLQIALLKSKLKCSLEDVMQAFLRAYEYRPKRAESLYFLARYLRLKDKIKLAYIYASVAASISQSDDRLFINYDIYAWKAKDELAVAAYWVENYQLSYELCLELLTNSSITDIETKQRIQKNFDFVKEKINQLSLVN